MRFDSASENKEEKEMRPVPRKKEVNNKTKMEVLESNKGEIVMYQPDETIRLEVRLGDETVWLTQAQMAELFQKDQSVIARHIGNVFREGELQETSNMQILHNTLSKFKPTKVYNLNVIISVGYRVKSKQGTQLSQQQCGRRIEVKEYNSRFHDRFLILDDALYHFGASFKDLGKRLFAFERMGIDKSIIQNQL